MEVAMEDSMESFQLCPASPQHSFGTVFTCFFTVATTAIGQATSTGAGGDIEGV